MLKRGITLAAALSLTLFPAFANSFGLPDIVGFIYQNGAYTPLSVPGAFETFPSGINNLGQIVGSYDSGSPSCLPGNGCGFLESGGVFTTINYPGSFPANSLTDINDNGQIIGTARLPPYPGFDTTFLYSAGTFTPLHAIPVAGRINDAGQIIGNRNRLGPGVLDTGGVYTDVNYPGAAYTDLVGIDSSGGMVGQFVYPDGSGAAFTFTRGAFAILNFPGAFPGTTSPIAMTEDGRILGDYFDGSGFHYFTDVGGVFHSFDLPSPGIGISNITVTDMNDKGQILGFYTTPEPSGWVLLCTGVAALGLVRRRRPA